MNNLTLAVLFFTLFSILALLAIMYMLQVGRIKKQKIHLESILETAINGVHVVDHSGSLVLYSVSFASMLGYTYEECKNIKIYEWEAKYSFDEIKEHWAKLGSTPMCFQTQHRKKDGTIIDVEIQAKSIWLDGEQYFYAVAKDITELMQVELKLLKHDVILESIAEGVFATDEKGICTFINQAALKLLGLEEADVVGKLPHNIFHYKHQNGEKFDEANCPINRAVISGKPIKIEDSFIDKSHNSFPVSVTTSPIVSDGVFIGSVVAFSDITNQKRTERALQTLVNDEVAKRCFKDKLLESVFEGLSFGVFITDQDGYFIHVNETFCKMTGYLKDELIGRQFEMMFPQETRTMLVAAYHEIVTASTPNSGTPMNWELKGKFDRKIIVYASFARIKDEKGSLNVVVSLNDVTKELELRSKHELQESIMIQQSKMAEMGEMIGAIIHQWKQPLNSIQITAQNLGFDAEVGELSSDAVIEAKNSIVKSVKFMSETMDNFRKFFRPQKEKIEFGIVGAVDQVIELFDKQLATANITIECNYESSPLVYGFENELKQVILNIINNAKDAISSKNLQDGLIKIDLVVVDTRAILTIGDNAGGISSAMLPEKIFEPYFTTKGENGTGIGLSLSKTIIEKHFGGKISAVNTKIGASFIVELPVFA